MVTRHQYGLGNSITGYWGREYWGRPRLQIHHTNTTGSHIGGNHDGAFSGLEFVQDPITFILLFVAVDSYIHS